MGGSSVSGMRLASFNVMHGASLTGERFDPDLFRSAVAGLGADVLALQEVDRDQPRSDGLDLTAEAAKAMGARDGDWRFVPTLLGTPGEHWQAIDEAPSGAAGMETAGGPAYGIGLVSLYPVTRWQTFRLPAAPLPAPVVVGGWPRRVGVMVLDDEPRVALAAAVETPAGPVTVVSTHLSFVPGWNAYQLRRLVAALADQPDPVVLLGDLNMPSPVATAVSRWRSLARAATYPSPSPRLQIDHALTRGGGTPALPPVKRVAAERTAVSDHAALVVDFS